MGLEILDGVSVVKVRNCADKHIGDSCVTDGEHSGKNKKFSKKKVDTESIHTYSDTIFVHSVFKHVVTEIQNIKEGYRITDLMCTMKL
jgi:hypothetical protein